MQTLDEAILYFREKAENSKKDEEVRFAMRSKYCKDIYNQTGVHIDAGDINLTEYDNCLRVVEWLTELKKRREIDEIELHADIQNEPKPTKDLINEVVGFEMPKLDKLGECKCITCKHNGTWECNNCHCFDKYEGGAKMKGGERE